MLKQILIGIWLIFIGLVPIIQSRIFGYPIDNPIEIFFQVFGVVMIIIGVLIALGIIKNK